MADDEPVVEGETSEATPATEEAAPEADAEVEGSDA